jgi:Arc/MetJ-type ribon-helix-helix transcriptional regulator
MHNPSDMKEPGPGRGRRHGGPGPGPGPGQGRGPGGGRGFGRRGGWQLGDLPPADDAPSWFAGRLPDTWFTDLEVNVDREEITVIGTLPDQAADAAAAEGRISRFRADTRAERIAIAAEAQAKYGRTVSWGARLGAVNALFTHLAVPVMTRLRQPERRVLDTLVDSGVARSRSEALAWSVRLVGEHAHDWLDELRTAMTEVDKLRSQGPDLS